MKKTVILIILCFTFFMFGPAGNVSSADNTDKVNINTATIDQLTTLKGIGPALAQRIIDYRQTNGNFRSTDDLTNVKGIGEKTLADMEDSILVGSAGKKE